MLRGGSGRGGVGQHPPGKGKVLHGCSVHCQHVLNPVEDVGRQALEDSGIALKNGLTDVLQVRGKKRGSKEAG